MNKFFCHCFMITSCLFAACSSGEDDIMEEGPMPGAIEIREAWVRPAGEGMMGGAYLTIINATVTADTLVQVSSDIAAMAEVHESYEMEDGMSGMRPAGNITVEARSSLQLVPGGYHIMLMQLNRDLAAGDSVLITLHFSRNGAVEILVPVAAQPNVQE